MFWVTSVNDNVLTVIQLNIKGNFNLLILVRTLSELPSIVTFFLNQVDLAFWIASAAQVPISFYSL